MRRFLLASAALLTIALTAPLAGAQYPDPTPAPPPYQTQVPDATEQTTDALAPTTPPTTEVAPAPASDPYVTQNSTVPSASSEATTQAQVDPYAQPAPAQTAAPDAYAQTPAQADYAQAAPDAYAANVTPIDLSDEAIEAGMDGVPMSAAEVCAPRSVSLTQSSSRLNNDARHHLINAADMASVCKTQRVVIRSPNGRADAARATLVDLGVDDSLIEVEQGDGGLAMELTFAGVATSSEQYAEMFNPVQTAAYASPAPAAETDTNQPTGYESDDMSSEPTVYEPAETFAQPISYAPPAEEPTSIEPSPLY